MKLTKVEREEFNKLPLIIKPFRYLRALLMVRGMK